MKITYIGHASILIEDRGGNLLIDPLFSDKVLFFKRRSPLPFDPKTLPPISAILISHLHLDHFDVPSLNYVKTSTPLIVPEGSGDKVLARTSNPVIELAPWASHEIGNSIKITAVPSKHSASLITPLPSRSTNGYIIEGEKTVYFAGDVAYSKYFSDIGNAFNIDVAILPIGSYRPRFLMKNIHMDPREALRAFIDTRATYLIPVHWGAFRLSLEPPHEPIDILKEEAGRSGIEEKIKILEPGNSLII